MMIMMLMVVVMITNNYDNYGRYNDKNTLTCPSPVTFLLAILEMMSKRKQSVCAYQS